MAQLNQRSIKYNWHDTDTSELEGVLARGDRRLGPVILEVYKRGQIYDAWTEYFNYQTWLDVMDELGVDKDFYTIRERADDEIFPWDFLDIGVTKRFLLNEWHNAQAGIVTPNCRDKCSGCGAAAFGGGICFMNRNQEA